MKTGNKKTPRKRTSALHYTRRRHASFVPGSCASGGMTPTGGPRRRRVRCEEEAEQKGEWGVNGKPGRRGRLELIQSRGGGSPLAVRGKEGEKQREITTPLLVIEIIRCQHSTSFTVPTFFLPPSSRNPSCSRFVFPSLDVIQIFDS